MAAGFSQLRRLSTTAVREAEKPSRIYQKLAALGATGGSVSRTLNEYAMEGKWVSKPELVGIVKELRRYRRHDHALEVMKWMANRNINFSFRDHAVYLDLMSKVKGAGAAENYFETLPASAKNKFTYGSLLNCYSKETMEDKALLLFKEMENLGFLTHALPYNNMMSLYMRMEKPEKIPGLVEEMRLKNVPLDSMTYNIWMKSYACLGDIAGVEMVYQEMSEKDAALCDWTTFSNLAAHYVSAGLQEKAEAALRKLELVMDPLNRESYHYLITFYTSLSNLSEVHRVWGALKAAFRVTTNVSHLVMLGCLRKLKDMEGLRKVFGEWESYCSSYDVRLAKIVISAYLDQDMVEVAEAVFKNASTKAPQPFISGTEFFMVYFLKKGRLDRCMEYLEAAAFMSKNEKWTPHFSTIDTFLMHFEGNGDVKTAEEMFSIMKDVSSLKGTAYNLLLKAYAAAGKTEPEMRRMLELDGVEVNDDLECLLQKVCPL